jgi:hypothetical protein
MSSQMSIWAVQAKGELPELEPILELTPANERFDLRLGQQSLWLVYHWKTGPKTAFRLTFSTATLQLAKITRRGDKVTVKLNSAIGAYQVELFFEPHTNLFTYTTVLTPLLNLTVPYWPKDMLCLTNNWQPLANAQIHAQQVGNRSGAIFYSLTKPKTGSVLYFQNLGSLNDYFEDTQTAGSDLVTAQWPELGCSLPATTDRPLQKGKKYVLTDTVVTFVQDVPKNDRETCMQYMQLLGKVYPYVKRPEPAYHNWLDIVDKGLNDLASHAGCWTYADGHHYLNAYVSDYDNPPEIMVQLALLLPLIEYTEWEGAQGHPLIDRIKAGLPKFYKEDIGTIVRWLPALERQLDHSEEQKKPNVMDSWYLHHPLMNLARLTERGDKTAKKMLMDSIDYAVKVAREFNYQWPVFYQMETLRVIKAETAQGEGGELDVPGAYADLMLKLWELTKQQKYLTEAKKSAKALEGLGFDVFYQANNTALGAVVLLKLFKLTGHKRYLEMSYVNLACIFKNVQLWDANYGHGKNFSSFFSIFPLKDAPYTAAYEEQEVYAILHEYLRQAKDVALLPEVRLLVAEFIKYVPARIQAYYPPKLPKDMLVGKPKTGELDAGLWIAIEDLQDGWEQSGQVGQEVYGAGVVFGIIPRQYFKLNKDIIAFVGYPVKEVKQSGKTATFKIDGSGLPCTIVMEMVNDNRYSFTASDQQGAELQFKELTQKRHAVEVMSNQTIEVKWQKL